MGRELTTITQGNAMKLSNLSPKHRTGIAFGAAMGVSHTAFRAFTSNFGPITGLALGLLFTFAVTYAIYWAMGLPLKKTAEPS